MIEQPYVPTTEQVRVDYIQASEGDRVNPEESGPQFDRWLSERDERVRAEFIASARTALPVLAKIVRTVIDSCEETISEVNSAYSPDDRDFGKHFHAETILDHIGYELVMHERSA